MAPEPQHSRAVGLSIDANRAITILFVILLVAEVFFVLADAIINVERLTDLGPIRRFFNITREDGVASWFGVTQTWMVGLTAGLLWVVARAQGAPRWRRVGWAILTLFLLYMALDDGAKFHERIGSSLKEVVLDDSDADHIGFFPSYPWQLVFVPIFGVFGVFLLWFLNRELTATGDKLLVVAAIGLLVLAVIADFFEGMDKDHAYNLQRWIREAWDLRASTVRHYSKALEEFMEMLAMTLLWVVFLRHLVRTAPTLEVKFQNPPR